MSTSVRPSLLDVLRVPGAIVRFGAVIGLFGFIGATWLTGMGLAHNEAATLARLDARVRIRAFLTPFLPRATVDSVIAVVRAMPGVANVAFTPSGQVLEAVRAAMPEFADVTDTTVVPATLDVALVPSARTPTAVARIAADLAARPEVIEVRDGHAWLVRYARWRTYMRLVMQGLAIVAPILGALVVLVLTRATVRVLADDAGCLGTRAVSPWRFRNARWAMVGGVIGAGSGGLAVAAHLVVARILTRVLASPVDVLPGRWLIGAGAVLTLLGFLAALGISPHGAGRVDPWDAGGWDVR